MPHPDLWLVVVPARLQSTRLAHKPLQLLGGKPLIHQVFANLKPLTKDGYEVVVATDAEEIFTSCQTADIPVRLTHGSHPSGTTRVGEIAAASGKPYILNVQGDEPFIHVDDLKRLVAALETREDFDIATLAYPSQNREDFASPSVVKAVVGDKSQALYFSRSPVPWRREGEGTAFWHHQGVYAYRRDALEKFCSSPLCRLEQQESLEQLRALDMGLKILIVPAEHCASGIDTPEDLRRAELRWLSEDR